MSRIHSDDGFTLTELLVVIALLSMVLVAAYSGLQLTFRATEIQKRDSFVSTTITQPMQTMEVIASQNLAVDSTSGDYLLSCLTDQNADNNLERHVYQATSDGQLLETVYSVNSSLTNVAVRRATIWQRATTDPPARNVNVALGVPLFTYYAKDSNGVLAPADPEDATECVIRIQSRYDTRNFYDQRRVFFRNR